VIQKIERADTLSLVITSIGGEELCFGAGREGYGAREFPVRRPLVIAQPEGPGS
jgi:hypothetical protein